MIDLSEYHFTYEHVEKNSFIDDDVIPKYDYLLKYLYIHCTVRNQYCVHLRNCTNTLFRVFAFCCCCICQEKILHSFIRPYCTKHTEQK